MVEPGSSGVVHQEKIIEMLTLLKHQIGVLRIIASQPLPLEKLTEEVSSSAHTLQNQIQLLEQELDYVFELLQSKHLMMEDTLSYIRQLEQELAESKPQRL